MKHPLLVAFLLCACLSGVTDAAETADAYTAGRELFRQGKFADALAKFQELRGDNPDNTELLSWIAAAHLNLSQNAEAEATIKQVIDLGGKSYELYELLWVSQGRQQHWSDASATIRRYREQSAQPAGESASGLTPDEQALRARKVAALEAGFHLEKRDECLRATPPERACADAELYEAWKLQPTEPVSGDPKRDEVFTRAWSAKGLVEPDPAKKAELFARAEAAARSWARGAESDTASLPAKNVLAWVLMRQKKFDDALVTYDEIRRLQPKNCPALIDRARAFLAKEDYANARSAASDAVLCKPEDAAGYQIRAIAAYGLGDCAAVVKDGVEYGNRAPGKQRPSVVDYCQSVLASRNAEADLERQKADYKRRIKQLLDEGDQAIDEAVNPDGPAKPQDAKSKAEVKPQPKAAGAGGSAGAQRRPS